MHGINRRRIVDVSIVVFDPECVDWQQVWMSYSLDELNAAKFLAPEVIGQADYFDCSFRITGGSYFPNFAETSAPKALKQHKSRNYLVTFSVAACHYFPVDILMTERPSRTVSVYQFEITNLVSISRSPC